MVVRARFRSLVAVAAVIGMLASGALLAPRAAADAAVTPRSGTFTLTGAGYGHGWGMSQYGAYGAAKKGLTWGRILAFYYPGTTLASLPSGRTIRVWIGSDHDSDLRVKPSAGLKVSDSSGHSYLLPSTSGYTEWRAVRSGTAIKLQYRNTAGTWVNRSTSLAQGRWTFTNTAKLVKVVVTNGSVVELRGSVAVINYGSGTRTINTLSMEHYLRSVVPAEMPTSWAADAVRSQAVAARSFAARTQANVVSGAQWDVCDTQACQVYKGYAATVGGVRTLYETSGGNAAVTATSGKILKYGSTIAFTQFSSSNGGHSAKGDFPYLVAKADPYDAVVQSNAWTKALTSAAVGAAWPAVGTVRQLQITARDGAGRYGGRVTMIKIIGSSSTLSIAGSAFRSALGLRSTLFTLTGIGKAYETFPRRYVTSSNADLLLITSAGNVVRREAIKGGTLGGPVKIAGGVGGYTHLINAGDWNGDGYQDVIARTSKERLLLFRGTQSGVLSATGVDMGLRSNHTSLTSVGAFNGDKYPDLLVVSTAGNLYICFGNGGTGFTGYTKLASGWGSRDWLRGTGDWNRDGRPDLITKSGDSLYLHRGTSTTFASPVRMGTGWSSLSTITSIGDFDGDGRADVIARTPAWKLVLYRGDGNTGFSSHTTLPATWTGVRFAT